jgi:hypothetical protein
LKRGISRRAVLRLLGLGPSALWLPGPASAGAPVRSAEPAGRRADALAGISPIDRTLPEAAPSRYSGDQPARAHEALWDKHAYLKSRPPARTPPERVALAIVGGGMSGLTSAYRLRRHRPVILEQATRFGGNSRGESWRGVDYSIGAAYFVKPARGSPIDGLIRELRLDRVLRERRAEDPVVLNGRRYYAFWTGETDPAGRDQFERVRRHFQDVLEERNGWFYPDIPVRDAALRPRIDALDRASFHEHLERTAGGRLHPHIETAIEQFCWSSFGASAREVSAACGLNFYAAEFDTLMVCQGGNAAVAEALLRRVADAVPRSHLRAGSLVLDVSARDDGALVTYVNDRGETESLTARAVILACPKFVAAKLVDGLEEERRAAMARLRYHAYLVANVMLRGRVADDFYDLFLLGDGTIAGDTREAADRRKATDVVLGSYARHRPDRAVLTLYRALPYAGARPLLLAEQSFMRCRAEFEEQILREILPLVGLARPDVMDIRIARWGHPLPVAQAGLIAGGVPEALRKPFRERVFFVEQDNWALPAFETAVTEALTFAPLVEGVLERG